MISASATAPLEFAVPAQQGTYVMGKAQVLIAQWGTIDCKLSCTGGHVMTDRLIETIDPAGFGYIGFLVTCINAGDTDEISVATKSYYVPATIWGGNKSGRNAASALGGAHILACLLEHYTDGLPTARPLIATGGSAAPVSDDSLPVLPDDLELYVKLLRAQLANSNYGTALVTFDSLKSAVADKQKEKQKQKQSAAAGAAAGAAAIPASPPAK